MRQQADPTTMSEALKAVVVKMKERRVIVDSVKILCDMGYITKEKNDEIIKDLYDGVISSSPHIKNGSIENRPLKFRVFDLKEIDLYLMDDLYWFEENHVVQSEECEHSIIEQSTGLIDKNGQEIYENDLVNFTIKEYECNRVNSYKNQLVTYDNERAMFVFGKDKFSMVDKIYRDTLEVVGNIHEYMEQ